MSDSFTETTVTSWTSRIGNSIKGVLFGLVLIAGSGVLLFWNEGRAVQTERSLNEGASLVVSVDPARVEAGNDGRLVHLSGDLKPGVALNDADFLVSTTALRLLRTVEMYQWKEESRSETRKNVGGSEETVTTYEYVRTWSETRNDSSRFRRPEGHNNPQMRYQSRSFASPDATLGAFRPGENVIGLLPANERLSLDPTLAAKLAGRFSGQVHIADGRIYLGANPSVPQIGDLRIAYRYTPGGPASIIGRQAGAGFADYQTKAGDRLLMARLGQHSAADMFAQAQRENTILTWILRAVGLVLMFVGFTLILAPLVVVADVVPFIGSILGGGAAIVSLVLTAVIGPLVIAVAWFWYRPLVSAAVLAGGLLLAYGFKRWASQRAAARRAQEPAAA